MTDSSPLTPALSVRDLCVDYYASIGLLRAVDGVSFDLLPGKTMALVGESGCGKSATALGITRMIRPPVGRIVRGQVALAGRDLMRISEGELRRIRGNSIGFVPQDPLSSLNGLMTIGQQVVETVRAHTTLSRSAARKRAIDVLGTVGIPQPGRRFDDHPHQFSGGMRQRVAIAAAIACEPTVLLADEPTTALDVTIQEQILDLLRTLSDERGMATLFITHDLAVASVIADFIGVMYAGEIVETADAKDFMSCQLSPYAQGLLRAHPATPRPEGARLRAIPGSPPVLTTELPGCRFAPRCPHVREMCRRDHPQLTPRGAGTRGARCWATDEGGWM